MKQKIIIKVQMDCEKCRTKALETAAAINGVSEVGIQGAERDEVMVIGDEVDPIKLTCSLRKKLQNATLLSVEEKKEEKKDDEKGNEKNNEKIDGQNVDYPQCQWFMVPVVLAEDPYRETPCSIL